MRSTYRMIALLLTAALLTACRGTTDPGRTVDSAADSAGSARPAGRVGLTDANVARLHPGMAESDVLALFGPPSRVTVHRAGDGRIKVLTYNARFWRKNTVTLREAAPNDWIVDTFEIKVVDRRER